MKKSGCIAFFWIVVPIPVGALLWLSAVSDAFDGKSGTEHTATAGIVIAIAGPILIGIGFAASMFRKASPPTKPRHPGPGDEKDPVRKPQD